MPLQLSSFHSIAFFQHGKHEHWEIGESNDADRNWKKQTYWKWEHGINTDFKKGTEAVLKGAHHIVNSYRDWLCYYVLFGADGAYTSNG